MTDIGNRNMKRYCKPAIEVLAVEAGTILAGSNPPSTIEDPTIDGAREVFGLPSLEPDVERPASVGINILGF